eukprot:1186138-Prorocentrum_minimum.AAC.2
MLKATLGSLGSYRGGALMICSGLHWCVLGCTGWVCVPYGPASVGLEVHIRPPGHQHLHRRRVTVSRRRGQRRLPTVGLKVDVGAPAEQSLHHRRVAVARRLVEGGLAYLGRDVDVEHLPRQRLHRRQVPVVRTHKERRLACDTRYQSQEGRRAPTRLPMRSDK